MEMWNFENIEGYLEEITGNFGVAKLLGVMAGVDKRIIHRMSFYLLVF